jgi:hypothetical protein
MDYEEFADTGAPHGHRDILANFTQGVLKREPLLAPGYDGIHELTLQNAAYLSAWKGNTPVRIPFDEAEYDRLLAQKQKNSALGQGAAGDRKHTEYSERWQIQW